MKNARRTLAPPDRRRAAVESVRDVGAYRVLRCTNPGPEPRPGQFYMLSAVEDWGGGAAERPYLPRAFSVLRCRDGFLEFVLEDVGPGTHRLGGLGPGDEMWVLGPLGVGFAAPTGLRRCVLVGGGVGIAPLAIWQDDLLAVGHEPRVLLGFRTAEHAMGATLLSGARVATDDGSTGQRGLVTDLLEAELDADDHALVYACGPPAMLEAVRVLCLARGVPTQLALESGMACGFGACFGCVVPTRQGYRRVCLDGPVFDGAELQTAAVAGAH